MYISGVDTYNLGDQPSLLYASWSKAAIQARQYIFGICTLCTITSKCVFTVVFFSRGSDFCSDRLFQVKKGFLENRFRIYLYLDVCLGCPPIICTVISPSAKIKFVDLITHFFPQTRWFWAVHLTWVMCFHFFSHKHTNAFYISFGNLPKSPFFFYILFHCWLMNANSWVTIILCKLWWLSALVTSSCISMSITLMFSVFRSCFGSSWGVLVKRWTINPEIANSIPATNVLRFSNCFLPSGHPTNDESGCFSVYKIIRSHYTVPHS